MDIQFLDRQSGKMITERPPAEATMRFLYDNPFGKKALLPMIKRKWVSDWYGGKMDQPASTTKIKGFVDKLGIDMSESQMSISEFAHFNDFFYRKLKPEARPIGEGFVSPGDGKLLAFETIADLGHFFVKGHEFTLLRFLNDTQLADEFADASMFILRLAPNDYHRYHFPYGGTASEMHKISGSYFSVSPIALAHNFVTVFCENKREFTLLDTNDKGRIIIAPVGATMVGGIVKTFVAGQPIIKGDEMGYFKFGGSTIVVILNRDKVMIDQDLLVNTKNKIETFVKMGEKIGL